MSVLDPARKKIRVRVVEIARTKVRDSFRERDALERRPDLGEFRRHFE
jgi:hypothetical protein